MLKSSILRTAARISTFPCRRLSTRPSVDASCIAFACEELKGLLSTEAQVTSNTYELAQHGKDESYHPAANPDLVVYPAVVSDIQAVLAIARRDAIPVIPFGAGTSVEGHINAIHGGISIDMKLFNSVEYNSETTPTLATVGAGVRRSELNTALRQTGYWFTVDPGADASLGGMMATAASGTTAVRYGTMREAVVACECVLADGTVVTAGSHSPKNSAGYNLVGMLTGSEGTLGIITQLTVRIHPVLGHRTSVVAVFDNLRDAADVAPELQALEVPVLRCELLDAASVQAFNDYSNQNLQVKPTLFLEFQSFSENALQEQMSIAEEACTRAVSLEIGDNNPSLWAARHKLYYAAIASRPKATGAVVTDACVPLQQFATFLEQTVEDVQRSNIVGPCFGHAGDGNLHCILPICDDDEETGYLEKIQGLQSRLMERTLAAGGSVSGEHGVGSGKAKYLERQYGPGAVHMMKLLKNSMDPHNILNPGKIIP